MQKVKKFFLISAWNEARCESFMNCQQADLAVSINDSLFMHKLLTIDWLFNACLNARIFISIQLSFIKDNDYIYSILYYAYLLILFGKETKDFGGNPYYNSNRKQLIVTVGIQTVSLYYL